MPIINVRLIGADEETVRAAIDELRYLTSGIVERPSSAPRLTLEIHNPHQGRESEWLAYGTLVIAEAVHKNTSEGGN